jgi:hypothetical protein
LFALFGAVQTPFAGSTARLLLNYPAQSSSGTRNVAAIFGLSKSHVSKLEAVFSRPERRDSAKQCFRLFALPEDPAE